MAKMTIKMKICVRLRKKIAIRINLKYMAMFFFCVSVVLLSIKNNETTKTIISKLKYNPTSFGDFIQKQKKDTLEKKFNVRYFENFEKSVL